MRQRIPTIIASICVACHATSALAAIAYQYDDLHRLTRVTYDDGSAIVYDYDAVGNRMLRVINTNPNTVYLYVAVDPPGSATVIRDPNLTWYPLGTPVTLTADVLQCTFEGWTGDVPSGHEQNNPLSIVMNDYKTVTLHALPPRGDINCDCIIDFNDINPFILALSSPETYALVYPDCNILNADCNGDGVVNFDDINPFVAILSGGG
jgi:YD repeat-containing protein